MKKTYLACIILLCFFILGFAKICFPLEKDSAESQIDEPKPNPEPELLCIFKQAYPNVNFQSQFDTTQNDWQLQITADNRSATLYWADGKFLPLEELANKDLYSPFLYLLGTSPRGNLPILLFHSVA